MMYEAEKKEIVKSGYLTKSPPGDAPPMSKWRRRWFVLRDSLRCYPLSERFVRLEYYQNESESLKLADPKGIINLKTCTRVSGSAPIKGHKFVFDIITKERMYHVAADTPSEKHEWMKTLNDLLFSSAITKSHQTHDLESVEFQIQRNNSKSKHGSKQVSVEARPQSFYDVESPDIGRTERKARPLPPTPGQELPKEHNMPQQPKPKPRNNHIISSDLYDLASGNISPNIEASAYEVPVQTLKKTPTSTPEIKSNDYEELPPTPPPRRRGIQNTTNSSFISLPDISDDGDYDTLKHDVNSPEELNVILESGDSSYGVLKMVDPSTGRRFSGPELLIKQSYDENPSSSLSPLSSSSFQFTAGNILRDESYKPVPSPRTKRKYYENTGYVPISDDSDYSQLSH